MLMPAAMAVPASRKPSMTHHTLRAAQSVEIRSLLQGASLQAVISQIDAAPDREQVRGSAGPGELCLLGFLWRCSADGVACRIRCPHTRTRMHSLSGPLRPVHTTPGRYSLPLQALIRALRSPNFREFADSVRSWGAPAVHRGGGPRRQHACGWRQVVSPGHPITRAASPSLPPGGQYCGTRDGAWRPAKPRHGAGVPAAAQASRVVSLVFDALLPGL